MNYLIIIGSNNISFNFEDKAFIDKGVIHVPKNFQIFVKPRMASCIPTAER